MPEAQPIRILIAEDHFIARAGLAAIVNSQCDMIVVAEAVNGEEAVASFGEHRPDIMLMDMRMPGMSGFDAVSAICTKHSDARIIALSTFGGDEDIRRALTAGAKSYLTKDVLHDELLSAIRAVHAGEAYLPATVRARLEEEKLHADLSTRELEVLELIVQGLSNKQLAWHLKIAEDTAKNHVKNILKKLGAADRTQAATQAIQRGIIHLD